MTSLLLIEDDPNDEELALIALDELVAPGEISVVRDGAEALAWLMALKSHPLHEWPQLILLDLKLPKISGYEVLVRLKNDGKLKTLPVVVFTSSNEEKDLVTAYLSGANAYVRKPIDYKRYRAVMRDLIGFWMTRNESLSKSLRQTSEL